MTKILKWAQHKPFLAGNNGAGQELSRKNGAGQPPKKKTKQITF